MPRRDTRRAGLTVPRTHRAAGASVWRKRQARRGRAFEGDGEDRPSRDVDHLPGMSSAASLRVVRRERSGSATSILSRPTCRLRRGRSTGAQPDAVLLTPRSGVGSPHHVSAGDQDRRGHPLNWRGSDSSVEQSRLRGRRRRARSHRLAGLCRDELEGPTLLPVTTSERRWSWR